MIKILLLIALSLVSLEFTGAQELRYSNWLKVFEYLHDNVTFDLAIQAEVVRMKAEAAVNNTVICEKLAEYGSAVLGGTLTLAANLTAETTAAASILASGALFNSAALSAIAQFDLAVGIDGDEVSFAAARDKEIIRIELLAQSIPLARAEARLQRMVDVLNISTYLSGVIAVNALTFASGVTCAKIESTGILASVLNPTDLTSTVLSRAFFNAQARIQLIDRLSALIPYLPNNVTADAVLRAKAGLTFKEVIDDLAAKSRQHFLETVARKVDTWEELKTIFGVSVAVATDNVDIARRVFFKRLRDFFDGYFADATLLANFDVDVTASDAQRFIELNITYTTQNLLGLSVFARRVVFVAKQFIYAFSHPFSVTFSNPTASFVIVRIYPAPLFKPRRVFSLDYQDDFDNISNGSSVPPSATDAQVTTLLSTQPSEATSLKASVQAAFDDFNQTYRKVDVDIQLYSQASVETYQKVNIASISTQIRAYASENFDLNVLKSRAISAAAQVNLTIRAVKSEVQEEEAKFNATAYTLARLEKGLTLQLLALLSNVSNNTSCNLSTDFRISPTSEQIYQASADASCENIVPIVQKSLPLKRQLLLAVLARKAHNATFESVSVRIRADLERLNKIIANVSASISDNFQTSKPREELHAYWESMDYKDALAKCLLALNNGSLTSVTVEVSAAAEVKRLHKVSAQVNLAVSGQTQTLQQASDYLVAQLPLCIAQVTGGDLTYIKAKATISASAKRDVEQNTVGAQQETDTSTVVSSTTSFGTTLVPTIATLFAMFVSLSALF